MVGLINEEGNYVVEPQYSHFNYTEGMFLTHDTESQTTIAFDKDGTKLFETPNYVYQYSEGLAPIQGSIQKGYVDKTGECSLRLDYLNLSPFENGIAKVSKDYWDASYYIDKKGNDVTDSISSGLHMFKDDSTNLFGYMDKAGQVIIPARFSEAEPFLNGYATVGVTVDTEDMYGTAYGIIDTKGSEVLSCVYSGIRRMKNGLFSVGEVLDVEGYAPSDMIYEYSKKAIFSGDLKQLSDWVYHVVKNFDENFICVSDTLTVSFYDSNFKLAEDLPRFEGSGSLVKDGNILRGELNYTKAVADRNGNIMAGPNQNVDLGNGIFASMKVYSPAYSANFVYPVLTGLEDGTLEDQINMSIEEKIIGNYTNIEEDVLDSSVLDSDYTVTRVKDLLIIDYLMSEYVLGGAHGGSVRSLYYINLANGSHYDSLTQLFKPEVHNEAFVYLSNVVSDQMKDNMDEMMYWEDHVDITPYTRFVLSRDGIIIYFGQYEVAPYAMGMPEFVIPYSELYQFIDYESEFWQSFN